MAKLFATIAALSKISINLEIQETIRTIQATFKYSNMKWTKTRKTLQKQRLINSLYPKYRTFFQSLDYETIRTL